MDRWSAKAGSVFERDSLKEAEEVVCEVKTVAKADRHTVDRRIVCKCGDAQARDDSAVVLCLRVTADIVNSVLESTPHT